MNQCDGCRAGKPLVKLVNNEFVEAPDGDCHVMGSLAPGEYPDLMGCEAARYCTCHQRPKNQACACCGMKQGERCFESNLHPQANRRECWACDSGGVLNGRPCPECQTKNDEPSPEASTCSCDQRGRNISCARCRP